MSPWWVENYWLVMFWDIFSVTDHTNQTRPHSISQNIINISLMTTCVLQWNNFLKKTRRVRLASNETKMSPWWWEYFVDERFVVAIFLSWRFFLELCITEARQALQQKIVKQAMISMQGIAAENSDTLFNKCREI